MLGTNFILGGELRIFSGYIFRLARQAGLAGWAGRARLEGVGGLGAAQELPRNCSAAARELPRELPAAFFCFFFSAFVL